ncbi:MAG: hypothetical protein V1792_09160 [Pseudomonadota bacterium]
MTLDEYLVSPDFLAFQDEALRHEAIRAVRTILSAAPAVKRNQLQVIPSVIQGASLDGLRRLAEQQKGKNTKRENKDFWTRIHQLLSATESSEAALYPFLRSFLLERGIIEDVDGTAEKKDLKQMQKRQRVMVEAFMERIIGVYFEHFTCHYFLEIGQRRAE